MCNFISKKRYEIHKKSKKHKDNTVLIMIHLLIFYEKNSNKVIIYFHILKIIFKI